MSGPKIDVRFVDNVLPALTSAEYRFEVSQSVKLPKEFEPQPPPYVASKRIRVAGPHFGLDPGDIVSVYPPANSQSHYEDVLPTVTLGNRSLPWQIHIGGPAGGPLVAPWCALFLLTPEEIIVPLRKGAEAGNAAGTQTVPLADYLSPGEAFGPQFTQEEKHAFELRYPNTNVTVVDISAEAFSAVAPALSELPYLAHARESETDDQEIADRNEDGWIATIVGNRLPFGSLTGVYVAHLVSLEGFAGVLPGTGTLPAATKAVRLLSLTSWVFNSIAGGDDFAKIMARLDSAALTMPLPMAALVRDPDRDVERALAEGYTAMRYETRLGEETTGWYRGPCLPVPMQRNRQPAYAAAEAALIYNWDLKNKTTTGVFDISFGVAWEIGRLAAVADRQFVAALLAWARENNQVVQLLAERMSLLQTYPSLELPVSVVELMASGLLRERAHRFLMERVAPLLVRPDPRATGDVHPLLARPRPLLGPPRDPTRILEALDRYPGVTPPSEFVSALPDAWPQREEIVRRRR
jgi:hypothetical protein